MPFPNVEPTGTGNQQGSGNEGNKNQGNDLGTEVPNNQTQAPAFQIDPRFQNLAPNEAIARTVQSMVTPLHQQIKELSEKEKKYSEYIDGLGLIFENREARLAFIRELEPELVSTPDIDEAVKKALEKEFGEDFQPDNDEAKSNHWSKSAKYFRKLDKLYKEFEDKEKNTSFKTYKEIKDEYSKRKTEQSKATEKQINEIKTKYNVGDDVVDLYKKWLKSATIEDHFLNFMRIQDFNKTPSISSIGGNGVSPDQRMKKINDLFG